MHFLKFLRWISPKSWVDFATLGFLLLGIPLLFLGGGEISRDFVGNMVWNLGHYFLFAAATYFCFSRTNGANLKAQITWVVILIGIGILVEVVQIFTPRDADVGDAAANAVGVLAVAFWFWRGRWYIWLGRIVFAAIIVLHMAFVGISAIWVFQIQHQQPLIADFESRDQAFQWRGNLEISNTHFSQGAHSLKFRLSTRRYSGITLWMLPTDWSNYRYLQFDLYNPSATNVELVFRVNDKDHRKSGLAFHDRFNRNIVIMPGWNSIEFDLEEVRRAPRGRTMNLHEIEQITLFAIGLDTPHEFYTDNWRLK